MTSFLSRLISLLVLVVASLIQVDQGLAFTHLSTSLSSVNRASLAGRTEISTQYNLVIKARNVFEDHCTTRTGSFLLASQDGGEKSTLPFWLDPGTRGGAVFLSFVLFLLPLIAYSVVTSAFGVDEVEAGKWIGVGFTATACFLWVSTYIFRVATKDMTYVSYSKTLLAN